jgi:hypothetical protein
LIRFPVMSITSSASILYLTVPSRDLRCVKHADKVIVDFKLLGFAFPHSLRLVYNDLFYKFMDDGRGKLDLYEKQIETDYNVHNILIM